MSRIEEAVDKMAAYVCDKVCRYRADGSLDQERLEDICAECEMGDHVCHVLNEHIRATDGKGRKRPPLWKDRLMDRFLQMH